MPVPKKKMTHDEIDLSAGLEDVDLSAGLENPSHGSGGSYEPDKPSLWDRANTGLISGKSLFDFATKPAMFITRKVGELTHNPDAPHEGESGSDFMARIGTPKADDSPAMAAYRVGMSGASKDTADTVSGFTSPVSLATIGLGAAGKIPGAAGKVARAVQPLVGAGYGVKGLKDVGENADKAIQGDPDAVQKTLLGGAQVAGGAAALTPRAVNVKSTAHRVIVPGTPEQLLVRATKPTVALPEFETQLKRSIPTLHEEATVAGKPIKTVKNLADTADTVRNKTYQEYENLKAPFRKPQGQGPYNPTEVDARPAVKAQLDSIPATDLFEKPNQQVAVQRGNHQVLQGDEGIYSKTKKVADLYDTDMPVEQADSIVRDTNAKLRAEWNKNAGDRHAALSKPETARLFSVDNTLRGQLYDTIEKGSGVSPRPIMQKYGDMVDIADTAGRRNTVFSRQQPIPLHEQLSVAQALGEGRPLQAVIARVFKNANNADWLTNEAFERYARTKMPRPGSTDFRRGGGLAAAASAMGRKRNDARR